MTGDTITNTRQLALPLPQWTEKDGVLYWCGGYAPNSLVGSYLSAEQKARKAHNDKILRSVRYAT